MRRADPEANEIEIDLRLIVALVGGRSPADAKQAALDAIDEVLVGLPVTPMIQEFGSAPGPSGVIVEIGEMSR